MSIDEYIKRLELRRILLGCPWWDIRVCCSRDLHRKYWYYRDGAFYCAICERLEAWIA